MAGRSVRAHQPAGSSRQQLRGRQPRSLKIDYLSLTAECLLVVMPRVLARWSWPASHGCARTASIYHAEHTRRQRHGHRAHRCGKPAQRGVSLQCEIDRRRPPRKPETPRTEIRSAARTASILPIRSQQSAETGSGNGSISPLRIRRQTTSVLSPSGPSGCNDASSVEGCRDSAAHGMEKAVQAAHTEAEGVIAGNQHIEDDA